MLTDRTDGCVFSCKLLTFRSIESFDGLSHTKMLTNMKFKRFVFEFELIDIAIVIDLLLADDPSCSLKWLRASLVEHEPDHPLHHHN